MMKLAHGSTIIYEKSYHCQQCTIGAASKPDIMTIANQKGRLNMKQLSNVNNMPEYSYDHKNTYIAGMPFYTSLQSARFSVEDELDGSSCISTPRSTKIEKIWNNEK